MPPHLCREIKRLKRTLDTRIPCESENAKIRCRQKLATKHVSELRHRGRIQTRGIRHCHVSRPPSRSHRSSLLHELLKKSNEPNAHTTLLGKTPHSASRSSWPVRCIEHLSKKPLPAKHSLLVLYTPPLGALFKQPYTGDQKCVYFLLKIRGVIAERFHPRVRFKGKRLHLSRGC